MASRLVWRTIVAMTLGTHRFQRAVSAKDPSEAPERARGQMRRVVSDNHSKRARALRECLVPINAPFPATARWKRRVPSACAKL